MMRTAIEVQLRDLVRRAAPGVRIYFPRKRAFRVGYSWNGRHLRPTGATLESQIHEIAHLLVSPPERRCFPEFGLGPDPYRRSLAERVVSEREAQDEELAACALQILIVRLLELNENAVVSEVQAVPPTPASVLSLRQRYPHALPPDWWQRALRSVS